jgi:hypothetical protein
LLPGLSWNLPYWGAVSMRWGAIRFHSAPVLIYGGCIFLFMDLWFDGRLRQRHPGTAGSDRAPNRWLGKRWMHPAVVLGGASLTAVRHRSRALLGVTLLGILETGYADARTLALV